MPDFIQGNTCNILIRQYQEWKGEYFVPEKVDMTLRWSAHDPMNLLPIITDSPWQIIDKSKKNYESFDLSKTQSLSAQNLVTIFIHSFIH